MTVKPSYRDVKNQESKFTWQKAYKLIAAGTNDNNVSIELYVGTSLPRLARKYFKVGVVNQMNKIVLKDGTIIPISPKQAVQVISIIMVSPNNKRIRIGDHPLFTINDMETDKKKIELASQTKLDMGSFPEPTNNTNKNLQYYA